MDDVLRWKPFSFSLSVSNTVGDSPFADYFYVKGATNGNESLDVIMSYKSVMYLMSSCHAFVLSL